MIVWDARIHGKADEMITKLAFAAGLGIGVAWIALAIMALRSAAQGFIDNRSDWGVGWGLVGILLLVGGCVAIVGTWWHQTRVKGRHNA